MRLASYLTVLFFTVLGGSVNMAHAGFMGACVDMPLKTFTAGGGGSCTFQDVVRFSVGTDTGEMWSQVPTAYELAPLITFRQTGDVYTISWTNLSGLGYNGPDDVGFTFTVNTIAPNRVFAMAPLAWTQLGGPVTPEEGWSQTLSPPPFTTANVTITYYEPSGNTGLFSLSQSFTIGNGGSSGAAVPEPGTLFLLLGASGAAVVAQALRRRNIPQG